MYVKNACNIDGNEIVKAVPCVKRTHKQTDFYHDMYLIKLLAFPLLPSSFSISCLSSPLIA